MYATSEMDMGRVHPWVGSKFLQIIWIGLDRLNWLATSKVEAIEMVRWGLRAGLL